jgi:peptidoglycan glycosyltransferase
MKRESPDIVGQIISNPLPDKFVVTPKHGEDVGAIAGSLNPPGSTFKLVVASAALANGYKPEDVFPNPPKLQLTGTTTFITNAEGGSCGGGSTASIATALRLSCNIPFAELAVQLGDTAIREEAEKFGFNTSFTMPLTSTASSYPRALDDPQTALTGFGQGQVTATPLQMAMVAAGIANGGTVMKPYLVDEVQSADLQTLDKTEPSELSRAVSPTTANELTKLMVATVNEGTASPAAMDGIEVAGKTGTAQSGVDGKPPYAWFVSFAPADDPQVAVAVMIESVPGKDTSEIAGGALGGPIAKAVMEAVIR